MSCIASVSLSHLLRKHRQFVNHSMHTMKAVKADVVPPPPQLTYNADESGMSTMPQSPRMMAKQRKGDWAADQWRKGPADYCDLT